MQVVVGRSSRWCVLVAGVVVVVTVVVGVVIGVSSTVVVCSGSSCRSSCSSVVVSSSSYLVLLTILALSLESPQKTATANSLNSLYNSSHSLHRTRYMYIDIPGEIKTSTTAPLVFPGPSKKLP